MKKLPELTYTLKLKTKNLLLTSCFLLLASLAFPSPIKAQGKNIVGVNIANHLADFDKAAQIVGSGGWVYIMANPGDCGTIQEMAQAHPEVNIVIRGQTPYQVLDANLALAWTATLANINTPNKIYFMPSNEPNGPSPGDTMDATALKNYIAELIKQFNETGVQGSKVILLSPMINQYQPNFESYIATLGGASFFSQFDGLSMNLYDTEDCGAPFCKDFYRMNAKKFQEVLERNYGVAGMPVYAIETGVVVSYPRYYDDELARFYQEAIPFWQSQSNLKMFGLFSYDPTPGDATSAAWNLFTGTKTAQVLKSHAHGGTTNPETFDEETFRQNWLQPKLDSGQLQFCDGCGIVADPQDCLASETTAPGPTVEQIYTPSRWVETDEVAPSDSDAATLVQTASLNEGVNGPIRIKSAAYYELFEDMSIPFARELAVYLAGPFVYQGNTKINEVLSELKTNSPSAINKLGVLTKLTPLEVQDNMRRDYWQKCNDGTFCSSRNIGTKMCPTEESNECLISDGTDIFEIEPPPKSEDFTNQKDYYQTYRVWQLKWGARWTEIPLVSNPYSRVNPSIRMHSTDKSCKVCGPSNYLMDTPWVSALYDISKFFNIMLIPPSIRETRRSPEEKPEEELLTSLPQDKTSSSTIKLASTKSLQPVSSKIQNQVLGQKTLLTQGCTENPFYINFSSDVTDKGNGQFEVCWSISPGVNDSNHNYCDWGYAVTVSVDGNPMASFHEPILPRQCFSWNPTITCHMGSAHPITVSAKASDQISVSMGITSGLCTGPCCENFNPQNVFPAPGGPSGPAGPSCQAPEPPPLKPDGLADPIKFVDGHAVCIDSIDTLTGHWEDKVIGQKVNPQTGLTEDIVRWACVGKCDTSFEYEVWPRVRFPFLNTIFADDSDYRGTFQIFRPTSIDDENWDWAGESYITWCHIPAIGCFSGQTTADIDEAEGKNESNCGGVTLSSALEIYQQTFKKPPAKCFDSKTQDLKTYPRYIGGVKNAQEFVLTALNPPGGAAPPPPIPSPPTPPPGPPQPPIPPVPPTPPGPPTPTPPQPPGPPVPPTEPTPVTPPPSLINPGCPTQVSQSSSFIFDNYTGDLTPNTAAHSDQPRQATIVSWPCKNYQVVFSQEASNDPLWIFPQGNAVRFGFFEAVASNDGLYNQSGRQTQNNQVSILKNQDGTVQIKWEYYDTDASSGNRLNRAINFYTFYPGGFVLREQKFVEKYQSTGYSLNLLSPTLVNPVSKQWSNFTQGQISKFLDVGSTKERIYFATPQALGASTTQSGTTKSEIEAASAKILRIYLANEHPFLVFGNDSGLPSESISETHAQDFRCYTNEIIGWTPNLKETLTQETLSLYPNTCPLFAISHTPQNASDGQHNFVLIGVAATSDSDNSLKQQAQEWLNSLKNQNLGL